MSQRSEDRYIDYLEHRAAMRRKAWQRYWWPIIKGLLIGIAFVITLFGILGSLH